MQKNCTKREKIVLKQKKKNEKKLFISKLVPSSSKLDVMDKQRPEIELQEITLQKLLVRVETAKGERKHRITIDIARVKQDLRKSRAETLVMKRKLQEKKSNTEVQLTPLQIKEKKLKKLSKHLDTAKGERKQKIEMDIFRIRQEIKQMTGVNLQNF